MGKLLQNYKGAIKFFFFIFKTHKRSLVGTFSIFMTVPLNFTLVRSNKFVHVQAISKQKFTQCTLQYDKKTQS